MPDYIAILTLTNDVVLRFVPVAGLCIVKIRWKCQQARSTTVIESVGYITSLLRFTGEIPIFRAKLAKRGEIPIQLWSSLYQKEAATLIDQNRDDVQRQLFFFFYLVKARFMDLKP